MSLLFLCSCQVPAYVAATVMPRAKVKAVYEPIDQKTLVFVDDPRGAMPSPQLAGIVAQRAARDLKDEKVIGEFVPVSMFDELRAKEADFDSWAIDKVGERLGARQVIYVVIDAFDPGGSGQELRRPMAAARLKVIDVASGKPLFPAPGSDHGVAARLDFKQPPLDADSHGRQTQIARQLADRLGRESAFQFYKHEQPEADSAPED